MDISLPHSKPWNAYDTEFYQPMLSDWRNFENWFEDGAIDATVRANRIYQRLLEEYEPPILQPDILEELDQFIPDHKRKTKRGTRVEFPFEEKSEAVKKTAEVVIIGGWRGRLQRRLSFG